MSQDKLYNHVREILKLTLGNSQDLFSIQIFDTDQDTLPFTELSCCISNQFLVLVTFENIFEVSGICNKIELFIGKQVKCLDFENTPMVYWFEGEERFFTEKGPSLILEHEPKCIHEVSRMKVETRLPAWLDKFIFEKLNATYAPDFEKFDLNLYNSEDEVLTYLGTYFPRSYAESYCIFSDLLASARVKKETESKHVINVLDFGCGTGGNIIGLLAAIEKYLDKDFFINIWAIDGNSFSLQILSTIIDKYAHLSRNKIEVHTIESEVDSVSNLGPEIEQLGIQSFDFITSFKTIGELISRSNSSDINEYYKLVSLCGPLLSETGLMLMLDVTTKTSNSTFLPIILNNQVRNFVRKHNEFQVLLPIPCNYYSHSCSAECFYYQEFSVTHRYKKSDHSRVVYKIIGRSGFVKILLADRNIGKFVINWKLFDQNNDTRCFCPSSLQENDLIDSYKLS